uniref:Uncharacterized protein n=1 Tax=Romanomermis culicivorax TaxID=13658 RepID=A0A915KMC5_ROMCU
MNKIIKAVVAERKTNDKETKSLKPVAFVVLFGDALHNFCDGLAMGAAFVTSASSGLSTTIAVICHELPHEVGDFAILLNSNMSVKNALFFNFLSALTAFAGLYVGIEAGQLESMRKWIFALVAGGFLYISLVHILNEIKEYSENMHWLLSIFLQNMGFIIGFVIVLLLAMYE